jgi:hypothetical protein
MPIWIWVSRSRISVCYQNNIPPGYLQKDSQIDETQYMGLAKQNSRERTRPLVDAEPLADAVAVPG